jgi:hypothetical protein
VVDALARYLARLPAVRVRSATAGTGGLWRVKLAIDVDHPLAWRMVQELGYALNYVSIAESPSARFYPLSPPPYMNGGPHRFLSWIVEPASPRVSPDDVRDRLEGRLPEVSDDHVAWHP